MTTPRYIVPFEGSTGLKSGTNSTIEITPTSGAGIPSKIDVDLSILNTTSASSGSGCSFDVYGIDRFTYLPKNSSGSSSVYGNNTSNARACDDFAKTFSSNYGSGFSIISGSSFNSTRTLTPTFNFDANNLPYCAINVTDKSFDDLKFSNGSNIFVDKDNNFINRYSIDSLSPISSGTQGITITCGSSPINYDYEKFNVEFQNDCHDTDKSFLIFTPKSGNSGVATLGKGDGNGTDINDGFSINNFNNQNGDFYLNVNCDGTSGNEHLVSELIDVVIS